MAAASGQGDRSDRAWAQATDRSQSPVKAQADRPPRGRRMARIVVEATSGICHDGEPTQARLKKAAGAAGIRDTSVTGTKARPCGRNERRALAVFRCVHQGPSEIEGERHKRGEPQRMKCLHSLAPSSTGWDRSPYTSAAVATPARATRICSSS